MAGVPKTAPPGPRACPDGGGGLGRHSLPVEPIGKVGRICPAPFTVERRGKMVQVMVWRTSISKFCNINSSLLAVNGGGKGSGIQRSLLVSPCYCWGTICVQFESRPWKQLSPTIRASSWRLSITITLTTAYEARLPQPCPDWR